MHRTVYTVQNPLCFVQKSMTLLVTGVLRLLYVLQSLPNNIPTLTRKLSIEGTCTYVHTVSVCSVGNR